MFFPSVFWKQKARQALKNHWLTALLILLTVNLPSLLVQGLASFTGNDLIVHLQNAVYGSLTSSGTLDAQALTDALQALEQSGGVWIMQALNLIAWLITPCLSMGMYHWMQLRLEGQEAEYATVFSRLSLFFKGIGLRLYITLLIFLFMLPGAALSVLSLLPVWLNSAGSRIDQLSSLNTSLTLVSLSSIAMLVLGVIAVLRYTPAEILTARQPDLRITEAARESKTLMKGHKGHLFLLFISFLPWYLLEMFLVSLCLSMFGSIASLMLEMLCSLALNAYVYTTVCAFCETLRQEQQGIPAEPPADSVG